MVGFERGEVKALEGGDVVEKRGGGEDIPE